MFRAELGLSTDCAFTLCHHETDVNHAQLCSGVGLSEGLCVTFGHHQMGVSHTQLHSDMVGLRAACIPLYVTCCLEHEAWSGLMHSE